jgi:hypothetical protein
VYVCNVLRFYEVYVCNVLRLNHPAYHNIT